MSIERQSEHHFRNIQGRRDGPVYSVVLDKPRCFRKQLLVVLIYLLQIKAVMPDLPPYQNCEGLILS
jgi:hypothetical protein